MIKAGDLVMVVRGWSCCGQTDSFGYTYAVRSVEMSEDHDNVCLHCGGITSAEVVAVDPKDGAGFALYMLKRIDPPALDDEITHNEEMTA